MAASVGFRNTKNTQFYDFRLSTTPTLSPKQKRLGTSELHTAASHSFSRRYHRRCAKTSSIFRHANHRSLLPCLFRQHSDRQNSSIRRHRSLRHEPRLSGKRPRRHQRNNTAGIRRSSHRRSCRAIPRRQRTKNQLLRNFILRADLANLQV